MTWLRAAAALAVALGISVPASAQLRDLELAPPEAPAAYRASNRAIEEPPPAHETAPLEPPAPPDPVDTGERFRDSFFAGLLGYGTMAGIGVLLGLVDGQNGDTLEIQLISIAMLAPVGISFGTWIGGMVHGGSRLDGAFVGTTIGALLGLGLFALFGGPSPDDPTAWSIGLLAPVIGSVAGAEIASALGGITF